MSDLPVLPARAGVNQDLLHPVFRRRLAALFAAQPGLSIYSGVRTYAHQKRLYDDYMAGRRPDVAANPDKTLGSRTRFGVTFTAKGSWHMVQSTGYSYAVDLAGYTGTTEATARRCGLIRTVPSERWHYEPDPTVTTPYDYPPIDEDEPMSGYIINPKGEIAWCTGATIRLFGPTNYKAHREMMKGFTGTEMPEPVAVSAALWKWFSVVKD